MQILTVCAANNQECKVSSAKDDPVERYVPDTHPALAFYSPKQEDPCGECGYAQRQHQQWFAKSTVYGSPAQCYPEPFPEQLILLRQPPRRVPRPYSDSELSATYHLAFKIEEYATPTPGPLHPFGAKRLYRIDRCRAPRRNITGQQCRARK